MKDSRIIALLFARKEEGLEELKNRYGSYCFSIASHILNRTEDCEECVNETWLRIWNAVPPFYPEDLKLYAASVTRNLALSRYRYLTAQRRGGGEAATVLDELTECISPKNTPEEHLLAADLAESINRFMDGLPVRERDIFLRRYFFMDCPEAIGRRYGLRTGNVAVILSRIRKKLKEHLFAEGLYDDK